MHFFYHSYFQESRFEAHAGFFRLSKKGKFNVYLLSPFGEKLIFEL